MTPATPATGDPSIPAANPTSSEGLTTAEAEQHLQKFGPNAMPEDSAHLLRRVLDKFWAPVPWLLEAAIILQIVLHKFAESAVIAGLLLFNAALSYFQEGRAQATLNALKSRLALNASVRRDGAWKIIPAASLVPGDLIKLSLGAVVAADAHLLSGSVLLDQSMLTGESIPIEAGPGTDTFSGALVRRGEATALVTATGTRTKFGRTAELVRTAHAQSSEQKAVLHIVRNLAIFNGVIIVLILAFAFLHHMPWTEIIPLLLTGVLAAIPVALPATFTLAAAIGARSLTARGVLPTRLSAVDEAAMMDILCSDKTGTLTQNQLAVASLHPMPGFDEAHLLRLAALASADGGQDPVDAAIRAASLTKPANDLPTLTHFTPFDPDKKTSEATAADASGSPQLILKGAFTAVAARIQPSPDDAKISDNLGQQGFRVLAVAAGPPTALKLVGFIALSDPPRSDSADLIAELHSLGVRTVMVTGDAPATAAIVAHAVGLDGPVCPPGPLPPNLQPETFAVFAAILPEGKFNLVQAFQKSGHVVGMCGDGANDAPALRQAQMGIAVSTATDVAKAAAGIVLTDPGLAGIVAAVKEGRITFQRILTYTLNSVLKKIVQVLLLAVGLLLTGHAVLTPMLMVIVMITSDFLAMSLTTDRVRPSPLPNSWQIGKITTAGVFLGACLLAFCSAILVVGKFHLGLNIEALRTLTVVALVFGSQAAIYAVRERHHRRALRPTLWLLISSAADILIISTLATRGIAMAPLPPTVIAAEFAAAVAFALLLTLAEIPLFRRLKIA